jgi:hypothetical protein
MRIADQTRAGTSDSTSFLSALVGDGRPLLALVALGLILSGLFAIFLTITGAFLPHDVAFLGMQPSELCRLHDCRIVHFIFHDRTSFGGTLIAIGTLYLWLLEFPLRRGEEWAWWTLLLSGLIGFLSFLSYLLFGYLDSWHAVASGGLLPLFVAGLWKSRGLLEEREGWRSLLRPALPLTLRTRQGFGRACLLFVGAGMALAGSVIIILGSTVVFVPQDIVYLGFTPAQLNAINSHLIRSSDRRARISPNATSPESTPEPAAGSTGAASNASRTHSARRIPAPRARSSSKANSASLTFVPTDFVRSGGFIEHRLGEISERGPHDACVSRLDEPRGQQGAGGGLRG